MADDLYLNRAADPATYKWRAIDLGGGLLYAPVSAIVDKAGAPIEATNPFPIRGSDGTATLYNLAKEATLAGITTLLTSILGAFTPTYTWQAGANKNAATSAAAVAASTTVFTGGALFQNIDTTNSIWLGPSGVTTTTGWRLGPGEKAMVNGKIDIAGVYLICSTATPTLNWSGFNAA